MESMNSSRRIPLLAALLLALAVAGCSEGTDHAPPGPGGGDGGNSSASDLRTDDAAFPGMSTLRVSVPQNLAGTARQLYATTSPTSPPTGMTTPLLTVDNPRVTAGQPFLAPFDGSKLKGNLYVFVFLLMQNGGTMAQPKTGVDYAGNTPMPFAFDGAQHEVGPVILQLLK